MIFVRPENWGQGIGGNLLDVVIEDARQRRMHAAQLWVLENNEPATRLYADRGFSPAGVSLREWRAHRPVDTKPAKLERA